jgi:hypothetical protein
LGFEHAHLNCVARTVSRDFPRKVRLQLAGGDGERWRCEGVRTEDRMSPPRDDVGAIALSISIVAVYPPRSAQREGGDGGVRGGVGLQILHENLLVGL